MAYVGAAIPSTTNETLVAGAGTFVADIKLADCLTAAILRSPHPHARIVSIDASAAQAIPGVVHVVTGPEVRGYPIPHFTDLSQMGVKETACYALAVDRVRYVGEPVAAIVAEDELTAYAALDLVQVEYEPLPAVTDAVAALKPDAPLVQPEWGDNVMIQQRAEAGDVAKAFAEADGVVAGSLRSNRITAAPLEPRGVVATWDRSARVLTCWNATQTPHSLRYYLSQALPLAESAIRIVQPAVGGSFGCKGPTFHEDVLIPYLAWKLQRPVRWIEERLEHFAASGHSRDTRCEYEASYTADGRVTGLRVRLLTDMGVQTAITGWGMAFVTWVCIPGAYKIPNVVCELQAVVTNKCFWQAYRGFGKDAASFFMNRIMDHVARETGLPGHEVRARNFIPPNEFPFTQTNGTIVDSGNYQGTLRKALELIGFDGFPEEQEAARTEGRYIGLGVGHELTPEGFTMPGSLFAGCDATQVRVTPAGEVIVLTGVTSPGGGNETGIAQIVADTLGCELERIRVVQGDTELCPVGAGNYSSRSIILGGSAALLAAQDIREKLAQVAASMLEAGAEDVEARDGRLFVRGSPDRSVGFEDAVAQVYLHPHGEHMDGVEPGLESMRNFKIGNVHHTPHRDGLFNTYPTWANATSACVVEVDPETGVAKVLRYALVHDSGRLINPLLAAAQLHGGIIQGIGGTLYEFVSYDGAGRPLTESFFDYTVPTAREWISIQLGHQDTPSPFTPLGTKGVGESGISSPPGAIAAAIEDALPHLDLRLSELPFTPSRLWGAIQAAEQR
jgi:carbon-monoxide dehydrogenase large subunit